MKYKEFSLSNPIFSTAKDDGSNDGGTDKGCHTINGQRTLETRHTGDEIADECQQGTAEGCDWHEYQVVGRAE